MRLSRIPQEKTDIMGIAVQTGIGGKGPGRGSIFSRSVEVGSGCCVTTSSFCLVFKRYGS